MKDECANDSTPVLKNGKYLIKPLSFHLYSQQLNHYLKNPFNHSTHKTTTAMGREFYNYKVIDPMEKIEIESISSQFKMHKPDIVKFSGHLIEMSTISEEKKDLPKKQYQTDDNIAEVIKSKQILTKSKSKTLPADINSHGKANECGLDHTKGNYTSNNDAKAENLEDELHQILLKDSLLTDELHLQFQAISKVSPVILEEIRERAVIFKPATHTTKTLVLDLDDTLFHTLSPMESSDNYSDANIINVAFTRLPTGLMDRIRLIIRPYAIEFLKRMNEIYEIIVFTAAEKSYADAVLKILDPIGSIVGKRLYREHCIQRGSLFIKDLRILSNRKPCNTVIVDNSAASFASQLDNGIHIPTYTGDQGDKELINVSSFLLSLACEQDVRVKLRSSFCMSELYQLYLTQSNE